ncbi:MAG: nucleoside-diphosphate sugar epimerase [Deltaproteobacteria bacterium RIFCSPLOWO2_02_FULL_53_8]|nr:MAG: nucleoside-diphosphate sugar epimerase [Deltaproteobacteria bacterium RIFCSPLOWO2_02_FULL_53_8]
MKIVVTGALGHIGSRLVRDLPFSFPGSEIVMVDNMMTQRYCSLFNLPKEGNYRFIEADITQMELQPLLEGADVVVHLAAITDAAGSFDRAEQVEQNNFKATKRVAEACAESGVRLITLSSTSVYGTQANVVDEDCSEEELKPQSPYATTKLKEERLVQQLVKERGLRAGLFRFGTIFGTSPGMRFHTAVNKFCWQAVMGQPITVWSTAYDQKRPYLDLGDAVRAVEFVVKNDLFTGLVYNVVTENATVRQVVDAIRNHVPSLEVRFVDSQIMNQLSYEVLNARFAKAGFNVSGNLENGIADAVNLLRMQTIAI